MDRKRQDPGAGVPSQIERFKETARSLGCDEDEAAFRDKLRVIARQKPKAAQERPPVRDEPKKRE